MDSRFILSMELVFDAIVSNCCLRPSIIPPSESIFDAFVEIISIVSLIVSSSALRFEADSTFLVIFSSSCLIFSITSEFLLSNFAVFLEISMLFFNCLFEN